MLLTLRLEAFLLLPEAELHFGPGLNVVTGETGTGKSILLDAIGYVVGGKADAAWLRSGATEMKVEAEFDLSRLPSAAILAERFGAVPKKGRLLLRREMTRNGRSKAWIGDRSLRLTDLREIGGALLAIHGQGEHRRLLDPSVQLDLVDRFAGALSLRDTYAAARIRWLGERRAYREAELRHAELSDKEAWHRDQFDEIDQAAIEKGEEETLRTVLDRIRRQNQENATHVETERLLFEEEGSALDRIETVLHRCGRLGARWDDIRNEIGTARQALRRARRLLPALDPVEEEDVAQVEERIALLSRLRKKYGGTEEEILARRERLAATLEETDGLRRRVDRLKQDLEDAAAAASEAGLRLRQARADACRPLCRAVETELHQLGMSGAELSFVLEEETTESDESLRVEGKNLRPFVDGIDRGSFRLRPNPGEGAGPLAAVASGGELSRALLALLTILGNREEPRTAIFDEVDAGVGGVTARAVASRLERLAMDRQVLLVTHLPLVACRASRHFRAEKGAREGRTFGTIAALERDDRIEELARMLAGTVDSRIARQHAEELLSQASGSKESG